jgi:hypothetical protein
VNVVVELFLAVYLHAKMRVTLLYCARGSLRPINSLCPPIFSVLARHFHSQLPHRYTFPVPLIHRIKDQATVVIMSTMTRPNTTGSKTLTYAGTGPAGATIGGGLVKETCEKAVEVIQLSALKIDETNAPH